MQDTVNLYGGTVGLCMWIKKPETKEWINCWKCSAVLCYMYWLPSLSLSLSLFTWVGNLQESPVYPSYNGCRRSASDGPPAQVAGTTGQASWWPVGVAYSSDSTCECTHAWYFSKRSGTWAHFGRRPALFLTVWSEFLTMGPPLPIFPLW